MHSKESIGGCDGENKIYVAIGKNKKQNQDMLTSILQKVKERDPSERGNVTIFLLHVFLPPKFLPTPLGLIPVSTTEDCLVQQHKGEEKQQIFQECIVELLSRLDQANVNKKWGIVEKPDVAKGLIELINDMPIRKLIMGGTYKKGKIVDRVRKSCPESCEIILVRRDAQKSAQTPALISEIVPSCSASSPNNRGKAKKGIARPFTSFLLPKRSTLSRVGKSTGSNSSQSLEDLSDPSFCDNGDCLPLESSVESFLNSLKEEQFYSGHSTMQWDPLPGCPSEEDIEFADAQPDPMLEIDLLRRHLDEKMREAEKLKSDLNRVLLKSSKTTEHLLNEAAFERKKREAAEWTAMELLKWGKKWEEEAKENGAMLKLLSELYEEEKRKNESMYRERDKVLNEVAKREQALQQMKAEVNSTLTDLKGFLHDVRSSGQVQVQGEGERSASNLFALPS